MRQQAVVSCALLFVLGLAPETHAGAKPKPAAGRNLHFLWERLTFPMDATHPCREELLPTTNGAQASQPLDTRRYKLPAWLAQGRRVTLLDWDGDVFKIAPAVTSGARVQRRFDDIMGPGCAVYVDVRPSWQGSNALLIDASNPKVFPVQGGHNLEIALDAAAQWKATQDADAGAGAAPWRMWSLNHPGLALVLSRQGATMGFTAAGAHVPMPIPDATAASGWEVLGIFDLWGNGALQFFWTLVEDKCDGAHLEAVQQYQAGGWRTLALHNIEQ